MIKYIFGSGLLSLAIAMAVAEDNKYGQPCNAIASEMGRLVVGRPKVIYTDAQMPYTMDGSWASLREADGSMTIFETAMAKKPYYFRHSGTPDNPLKKALLPFAWDYNGYNHIWPSGGWIQNIYQGTNGTLVGLVHREDTPPGNGREHGTDYFIGLAKSTDGGLHWKYLGDVIANRGNGSTSDQNANMGGVPYLIVNGYLYLYFNEHEGAKPSDQRWLAVARAKLDDVMSAMAHDQVTLFKKYSNGTWTEDGMTGLGSEIIAGSRCRNGSPDEYDFHSDATYCKPLGRYLITVQTHASNTLLLYSSADGVDWKFAFQLDCAPGCMLPYSSFISFNPGDAADGHEVGSEFYIYYPRKLLKNYDYDTMCRIACSVKPLTMATNEK